MPSISIRDAVSPDIELFARFDHSVKTDRVWQMSQSENQNKIITTFNETRLPREAKLGYPRSPENLIKNWKNFSTILTACKDEVPVGYLSINTIISSDSIWIKDLVVDLPWRQKGIASLMIKSANNWGKTRGFQRMVVEMASKNFPAISFSRKLGFIYSGFNDQYLENNDIAIFFSRLIN